MEMTIREIEAQLCKIGNAEDIVHRHIPAGSFEGQEPLYDVLEVLGDYRDLILELKVHI